MKLYLKNKVLASKNTSAGQIWAGNDLIVILALTKDLRPTEAEREWAWGINRLPPLAFGLCDPDHITSFLRSFTISYW